MARIVELFIGLNAIGGILTFLGVRWSAKKVIKTVRGEEDEPEKEEKNV